MSEKITWLLAVKNGMPYLPETLASIEAQTYPNWEVLVWDNGSTDGTIEELRKWIPNRLPGRLVTDKPLKLPISRARMVEICETEIIALIDADDINLPDRLEKQVEYLSSHPDIAVLGSWMYFINENGEVKDDLYTLPLKHDDIVHEMLTRNAIAQPSVMFKKSAVLAVGNYRYLEAWNQVNIEDYDLWLRISQKYKITNLDTPLVKYRIHESSTTQIAIKENRINGAMDACISENAAVAFGCSEAEMMQLRTRSHKFAIFPILKIASYLQLNGANQSVSRLSSPTFLSNTKSFVSSQDILSRLFLSSCYSDKRVLYREIKSILKSIFYKIYSSTYLKFYVERYHVFKKNKNRDLLEWLKELEFAGSLVHPSLEFTGIDRPLDVIEIESECIIERDVTLWLSPDAGADVKFIMKQKAFIGRNTYIGIFQPIVIGENSLVGAYSYIISGNHNYDRRDIPIKEQGFTGAPIVIEDDVWVGTHVVILPGVKIGKGAVIAAHSLVNKDVPDYEVWGGIPARFLKHRPE